ncbi:MAG: formate dehydrogenase, partial [Sphingomonas sp.]
MRPGNDGEHVTFCRLCEAFCGLVATVRDGRVVAVKPDCDNPHSRGHVCVKGMAIAEVTYDPDRVTTPLRRTGPPGEFAPVSWDEALDDIAARLTAIRTRHGGEAIASYLGNPTGYSARAFGAFGGFMSALGSRKMYGAGSQDSNARLTATYMIHGGPHFGTVPDLPRCDFLLILGANPLVSNGWMAFNPRWRHDLDAIAERGSVVVVDPRYTETARRYRHLAIRPDGDAWLLIGLLQVLFAVGAI